MQKTPNEIKTGLECCISDTYGCNEKCPYFTSLSNGVDCAVKMHADALALIQQLEAANDELLTKVEQLERERDALVDIIKYESTFYNPISLPCRCCKNNDGDYTKDKCRFCGMTEAYGNFEWCGVKEEERGQEI